MVFGQELIKRRHISSWFCRTLDRVQDSSLLWVAKWQESSLSCSMIAPSHPKSISIDSCLYIAQSNFHLMTNRTRTRIMQVSRLALSNAPLTAVLRHFVARYVPLLPSQKYSSGCQGLPFAPFLVSGALWATPYSTAGSSCFDVRSIV
jgi:hypothetical protein